MNYSEQPIVFSCADTPLIGIIGVPAQGVRCGVLIVVGGPQYRSGSHRQFTLLARDLAAQGIPSFRFDYRGMGDSAGEQRTFDQLDEDLRAAVNTFFENQPDLREVVIWGLCDGASAALMYAYNDARVRGLVLLNPWVHTERAEARTRLKHYYWRRVTDPAFWRKVVAGQFRVVAALRDIAGFLRKLMARPAPSIECASCSGVSLTSDPLPIYTERMLSGLKRFRGNILLILSGEDFTSQEFQDLCRQDRRWRNAISDERVLRRDLSDANHTFARRAWRDQVSRWTGEWVRSL